MDASEALWFSRARKLEVGQYVTDRCRLVDGCWLWGMALNYQGYGMSNTARFGRGQTPHRLLFEALNGEIPASHRLKNTCGHRNCARPDHWKLVSGAELLRLQYTEGRRPLASIASRKGHLAKHGEARMQLAVRARELRAEGLTYLAISLALGVPKSSVTAWATGRAWMPRGVFSI